MMHQCVYCGLDSAENICHQKCDKCFESGKRGERQTGRTCAVLSKLRDGDVFIVPHLHYLNILKRSHPWLRNNLATPETLEHLLKGRVWRGTLFFDHTMHEQRPEAIEKAKQVFAKYVDTDD